MSSLTPQFIVSSYPFRELLNIAVHMFSEFDQLVSENKDAADEALNKIPDIETLIGQARNITKAANNILHGVEFDAKEGLRLAALAETTAAQASEVCPV